MMHFELYLPFPPTVNNYYVKTSRGLFISQKGRKFRAEVYDCVHEQLAGFDTITDNMLVEIILYQPDRRRRDIDNYNKALLDAISHSGLWEDDSLIDQLFVYRGEKHSPSGSIFLRITDSAPVLPLGYELPLF